MKNIRPKYSNGLSRCGALTLVLILSACVSQPTDPTALAQRYPIIDTHIDVPYRLFRNPTDVSVSAPDGQFDYPRAVAGGLNAPFMSIYIPAVVDIAGNAYPFAESAIDLVEGVARAHPDKFAIATCSEDIAANMQAGLMSLPMGMENGAPIGGSFENLAHFHARGIRYVTLAHSRSNHISDSSYDPNEVHQGLSAFGRSLIPEMNRLGVMIDVSHISDKAFWQVMELSAVPVLATHSSMRKFTPGFQRNMSDAMLVAMAERGGVIQINYGSNFLHQASQNFSAARTAATKAYQEANHLSDDDPALSAFRDQYTQQNAYPFASLDIVLDHIDHAVAIAGIDAVGIGSDYDGVGNTLPVGLKDVTTYPNLIAGLQRRGYSEADIAKILGGNTLRVWRAAEDYARSKGVNVPCASG